MRAVVWFILLFVVAVVAAATFGANDGLVSLYWGGWRMDVSMNLFLLALLLTCLALVTIFQAVNALVGLPRKAHEWRVARRDRTAQAALRDALAQFFGGRYSRAQKAAQRALLIQAETPDLAQDNEFTVLGHLLAAGSAHKLQDRVRRDEELEKALELSSRSSAARSAEEGARLLAAEWALDDRDAARALSLLSVLPPGVARRTHALRLKLQACRLAQQPHEALKTARLLAKHQAFSKVAAQGLLRSLAFESLDGARDADQVRRTWFALDAADRRDPLVVARAAERMAAFGAQAEGRAWLRPFWDRLADFTEDDRVALADGLVACMDGLAPDWLARLEAAALAHPREAAVAYAVGCALAERELWGKARLLLEQAALAPGLHKASRRRAWLLLAKLADQQSDVERAASCYREAAAL
ncbi:heme biosynthesis HemY N-terminal domain-containing protein [Piscinibacter gummiphilus]|uniref:Heme biosynthesis HemY N-terminal domain-containing protein n=1 Tax=Piscinibacter gummiphilus TaxID=946333 RepID=A0ABZ0CX73_9BURK|nr:heme biosynthesis HemY N-terminal domain-containing protein [Piscinibacter gummiphilus]WOB09577.1 heme biosynthesis HemY N-terminal domain-containing protein [Piscinibacter gummiphilus]